MSLVTLKEVMEPKDEAFAVGAFSTYDLSSALGIVEGAEAVNLPVIAMMGAPVLNVPGNEKVAETLISLAKMSSVPVVVHLDHAKDFATCMKAIKLGFSSVMIDGSTLSLEENIAVTNKVTEAAKAVGVSVEAELGALAGIEDGEEVKAQKMTNPEHMKTFLEATDVDGLAVSIGNAHGLYKGEPNLNFELLEKLNDLSDVPLIMHGGTGLTQEQFAKGIQLGIKKINIGTEIKKTTIETFIETHGKNESAWDMIGIPKACREAISKVVADKLKFYRSGWKELV
ncbi:MAG: fructose-bisphosphate aldolase, class [Clostridia bacterium]|jgi:fructose-bisphosphate aldolase class II|nr:iolJ [Clostridiales bacterium]MDK2986058.1 fructose-bisphosphate aldolase, class [Clostridia bacterium]